jgi:UDP-glucose 4-epimerase
MSNASVGGDSPSVAVVGGNGFIGSRIARSFTEKGWKTAVFTRADPLVEEGGALSDRITSSCGAIIWAATQNTPATAAADPRNAAAELAEVQRTLAQVKHAFPDIHVVFLSSGGTVYADREAPHVEDEGLMPATPYACLKVDLENLFLDFAHSTILRISNAYGPGQTGTRSQGVLAHWLRAIATGNAIHVYGNLETERDYIYVDDIARAVYAVIAHRAEDLPKAVFNVGSGSATSLKKLLEIVLSVTGANVSVVHDNSRGFDLNSSCLDITAIRKATGWTPRVLLPEGIERMWKWIQQVESVAGSAGSRVR